MRFFLQHQKVLFQNVQKGLKVFNKEFTLQPNSPFGIEVDLTAPSAWDTVQFSLCWESEDNLNVVLDDANAPDYTLLFTEKDNVIPTVTDFSDQDTGDPG